MGTYTGVHIDITLKPDAPDHLKALFNYAFTDQWVDSGVGQFYLGELLRLNTSFSSGMFKGWNKRTVTEDEKGIRHVSFSSTKWTKMDELIEVFNFFLHHFVVEPGQIVYRTCSEDCVREEVFYLGKDKNGRDALVHTVGRSWSQEHEDREFKELEEASARGEQIGFYTYDAPHPMQLSEHYMQLHTSSGEPVTPTPANYYDIYPEKKPK